eukprot:scaffold16661_cov44-Cyclotella_meneghiniana.AAC.1
MGGLLQKIEQECFRIVAGDATINRVLEVHRSQSATCNHTAIVIVGVADGYSGNDETSHQPVLERVWTLQKDQY